MNSIDGSDHYTKTSDGNLPHPPKQSQYKANIDPRTPSLPPHHNPRHKPPRLGPPRPNSPPLLRNRQPPHLHKRPSSIQQRKQSSNHSLPHPTRRLPIPSPPLSLKTNKRNLNLHQRRPKRACPAPERPRQRRRNGRLLPSRPATRRRSEPLPPLPRNPIHPPLLPHIPLRNHPTLLSNPHNLHLRRPNPRPHLHKQATNARRHHPHHYHLNQPPAYRPLPNPRSPTSPPHPNPLSLRRSRPPIHPDHEQHLRVPASRGANRHLQNRWGHGIPAASLGRHVRDVYKAGCAAGAAAVSDDGVPAGSDVEAGAGADDGGGGGFPGGVFLP